MAYYKAEGIILKEYNLGEADRILVIYTKEYGKFNCVAKGVRRSKSKLRGFTQPLTYADLVLYSGKSLDTLTQSVPKEMFSSIRGDLERWAYASYLVELLISMVPEREPQIRVFSEFLTSLHLVANLKEPSLAALFFTVKLLQVSGYQPELNKCVSCYSPCEEGVNIFLSAAFGGILCTDCIHLDVKAMRVKGGEIAFWRQLSQIDPKLLQRLKLSVQIQDRLTQALYYYYQYQLERQLKSPSFLTHLQSLNRDKNSLFKKK